mmetsp:Transcript_8984/g.10151  ORF Transcript_8984/g.10151 Transcript_8984/m.10151 type:complete len:189 (+) Transcript_8984:177-743(+)
MQRNLANNVKGLFLVLIGGFLMVLSAGCTIIGLIYSMKAHASPGLMTSLQLISVAVAFVLGIVVYREVPNIAQGIGTFVLLTSLVCLITIVNSKSNDDTVGSEPKGLSYFIAVGLNLISGVAYGTTGCVMKYANIKHRISEYEFMSLGTIFGSVIGIFVGISVKPSGRFINFENVWYNIFMITIISAL